ncbi:MAG: lytic transglycosylase domain-containing protein [Rikenellaceae bacterium]|jgi:hypothetical protein|nr:lytic transglycosylase domain-containing protein [Rikenellaceae bacterium]
MTRCVVFIFLALLCGCVAGSVPQNVGPAPIPDTLTFAGEAAPLQYRDVREGLQHEMLTTTYMHARTTLTLLAVKRIRAVVLPIMRREGLPDDFFYLCMAESGLSPEAVSSAGAGGLWQFMPEVGKSYGLTVNKDVDERYHIEKATVAACAYLKEAYRQFGSWTLAAASYNIGFKGVASRLDTQKVGGYYDLFFPQETLRYVFRILSFKLLCADMPLYGYDIPSEMFYKPYPDCRTVEVADREIDWSMVAIANGTNYKLLREMNPWIRTYNYKNDKGMCFTVKIPEGR